jgi:hypothetical protein
MGHEEENRSIAKAFVGVAVILWLIISIVASVLAQVDDESEFTHSFADWYSVYGIFDN